MFHPNLGRGQYRPLAVRRQLVRGRVDPDKPEHAEEGKAMKHLLTGAVMVAALASTVTVLAQPAGPPVGNPGGNSVGTYGPNPGGPGLTPYTGGAPGATPPRTPSGAAMAPTAMPPAAPMAPMAETPSPPETTSAMPPHHRAARHAAHGRMTARHGRGTELTGNTADQLNQEELARLQAGNTAMPMAPPEPGMAPTPRAPGLAPHGGSSGAGPR